MSTLHGMGFHCTIMFLEGYCYLPFYVHLICLPQSNLEEKGLEALDLRVPFDEKATLEINVNYLVRSLEV